MNEQTVTEQPDGAAQQASEANGEQDMDALLKSYDEKAAPAEPAAPTDEITQFRAEMKQDREERYREQNDTVVNAAVKQISEGIDAPFTDDLKSQMARGFLLAKAEGDPRIIQALANAKSDPKTWNAVLDNIAQTISSGKLDAEATSSRNAMVKSMTGGRTSTAPDDNGKAEAERVSKMSISQILEEAGA